MAPLTPTAKARASALPRAPRSSAVTLTLSEGSTKSYAEVLAEARKSQVLQKCGLDKVRMRKATTGAIVISVPEDAEKTKATQLATHLSKVLDSSTVKMSTSTTMAEMKVVGIDISLDREEIQQELAKAAGCEANEVKVWETGASRSGMGTAFVRCPAVGARKLVLAGRVALGWTMAKVIALHKRPLQCFRCFELGHVGATCVSPVDRAHLCYRCGESGHRARGYMAPTPKFPICESRGGPADHRMGSESCRPPKTTKKGPRRVTLRKPFTGGRGTVDTVGSVTINGSGQDRHGYYSDLGRDTNSEWPGGGHGGSGVDQRRQG